MKECVCPREIFTGIYLFVLQFFCFRHETRSCTMLSDCDTSLFFFFIRKQINQTEKEVRHRLKKKTTQKSRTFGWATCSPFNFSGFQLRGVKCRTWENLFSPSTSNRLHLCSFSVADVGLNHVFVVVFPFHFLLPTIFVHFMVIFLVAQGREKKKVDWN